MVNPYSPSDPMYKAYGAQQVQESLLQRDILEQSAARGNAAAQAYVAANPQLGIPLQSGPQQSQAAINGGDTTPITNLTTISSSGKQTVYDYGIGGVPANSLIGANANYGSSARSIVTTTPFSTQSGLPEVTSFVTPIPGSVGLYPAGSLTTPAPSSQGPPPAQMIADRAAAGITLTGSQLTGQNATEFASLGAYDASSPAGMMGIQNRVLFTPSQADVINSSLAVTNKAAHQYFANPGVQQNAMVYSINNSVRETMQETSPSAILSGLSAAVVDAERFDFGGVYTNLNKALLPVFPPAGAGLMLKSSPPITVPGSVPYSAEISEALNIGKGVAEGVFTSPIDAVVSVALGGAAKYVIGATKIAAATVEASEIPGISTVGRALISPVVADLGKLAGIGVGVSFAYQTGKQILSQPTAELMGEAIGTAFVQIVGFGAGFGGISEPTRLPGVTGTGTRISNFINSVSPIKYSVMESEGGQTLRVLSVKTPQWNDGDLRALDAARTYALDTFPDQAYNVLQYRPTFEAGGFANADLKAFDQARTFMLDVAPGKMYQATTVPYTIAGQVISAVDKATLEISRANPDLQMFDQARTFMLDVAPGKMYQATTVPYTIAGQALTAADRLSYKISGATGDLRTADAVRTYLLDVAPAQLYAATQKPYEIIGSTISAADRISLAATRYTGDLQAFDAGRTYVLDTLPQQLYNILLTPGPTRDFSKYAGFDLKVFDAARIFVLDTIPERMPVMPDISYVRGTSEPGLYSMGVLTEPGSVTAFRGFPDEFSDLTGPFGDLTGFGDLFKFTPAPVPQYAPPYSVREFSTGKRVYTPLQKSAMNVRAYATSFEVPEELRSAYRDIPKIFQQVRFLEPQPGITETSPALPLSEPKISLASTIGDARADAVRAAIGDKIHVIYGSVVGEGQRTGLPSGDLIRGFPLIHDVDLKTEVIGDLEISLKSRGETPAGMDIKTFEKNYPAIPGRNITLADTEEGTTQRTGLLIKIFGEPIPSEQGFKLPFADEVLIAGKDYEGVLNSEPSNIQFARKAQATMQDFVPQVVKIERIQIGVGDVELRPLNEQFRTPKDYYDMQSIGRDLILGNQVARGSSVGGDALARIAGLDNAVVNFDYLPKEDNPIIGAKASVPFRKTISLGEIREAYEAEILKARGIAVEEVPEELRKDDYTNQRYTPGLTRSTENVISRAGPGTAIPSIGSMYSKMPDYTKINSPPVLSSRVDSGISIISSATPSVLTRASPSLLSTSASEFVISVTGRSNGSYLEPSEDPVASLISIIGSARSSVTDLSRSVSVTPSSVNSSTQSYFNSVYGSDLPSPSISSSSSQSPSPSGISPPGGSPGSGGSGGSGYGFIDIPLIYPPLPPTPYQSNQDYYKRKRKKQTYNIFRELLPIITPREELGGFKTGKSFFRAIGNQQILKVQPTQKDWMYWVDRDVSNEDKQQGSATERTTDLAGMNFYRTATKAEKAKTGKSILKYKPTQEEFNMAKITGISSPGKSKKIWKNLWV